MSEGWSTEEIAEQFLLEVRHRFAAQNATWRRDEEEEEESARMKTELHVRGEACDESWLEPSDGHFWQVYSACEISVDLNVVRVVLPRGHAIGADFVEMFCGISVNWSHPFIQAEIVDGKARVVIEVYLVDYWDDTDAEKWRAEHGE